MKPVGSVVLLALSLVIAGCATRTAPNPAATAPGAPAKAVEPKIELLDTLAGTSWTLIELDGAPISEPVEGWAEQSLEFDVDGLRVTGNGGVNRFGGRFTEKGKTLLFGPLAMTRRAGPPAQMDAEQLYTAVLSRVVEWRQDMDKLILVGPGERRVALFERAKTKAE
jgi:heat shock protein HslJ